MTIFAHLNFYQNEKDNYSTISINPADILFFSTAYGANK